jgi:hypothetical protein
MTLISSKLRAIRSVEKEKSSSGSHRRMKKRENCFLNCLLPTEAASAIGFYIDEIEMEILHTSWASEFSHSLV